MNFEKDLEHGYAKMIFAKGGWYEGEFNNGYFHGKGIIEYNNGDKYQGDFENGKAHGFGTYWFTDKSVYKGGMVNGIFHGDADPTIPVQCSRDAYTALRKAGADVEYIEIPGCGHGCWNPAFSRDDFMEWLFKQKKPRKYLK